MIEAVVMSCKKRSFPSKSNPNEMVEGHTLAVALPEGEGWIEVWSKDEHAIGDKVILVVTEGRNHKAKVRVM